jgi:hypothetical protein
MDCFACGLVSGFLPNVEHVHPLPATGEDAHGVWVQTTMDAANTAAGSGLHDASCSASSFDGKTLPKIKVPALRTVFPELVRSEICSVTTMWSDEELENAASILRKLRLVQNQ